ncbi:lipid-A-disaccharide synthase [Deferribacter autotrophicus]|uniref:Lipid-A-disaccharide synthase n=1 Tax=Deferribacter autotrophicus TaxID=500465 RepID=A0A5A8F4X7_9BACT|nr:lipid-A-disaccharide synthase [Deferribacter autotrophicus]KAA0258424.1 lipid-A-disaccharide synthase [Deferribacter autotrophicus]
MKLFLIAGEESGDIHASNMIRHLSQMADFSLYGTGGDRLKELGQTQYFHINDMSIIGIDGIIRKAPFIANLFKTLKRKLLEVMPDVVILVDYPGFNLRFAKFAKENGFKVIYYIAPQVWAWHYSRIEKIKEYVDLVLCILPFEEELFKKKGINAKFVGNPIIDNIKYKISNGNDFMKLFSLTKNKKIIGILPGSRVKEIRALMPVIMQAIKNIKDDFQFVIAKADNLDKQILLSYIGNENIPIAAGYNYDVMKYSDLLWVCSGTATLESAIVGTPLILMYKVGKITEILGRLVIKTKYIGLPNIVADKEIVPELLQSRLTPENLIDYTFKLLENYEYYKNELSKIGEIFSIYNPSQQAAQEIYSFLNS